MASGSQYNTIGCIEKCTTGLTIQELNQITDNINATLSHPQGRKIFRKYLQKQNITNRIDCLDLYEICLEFSEDRL